MYYYKYIVVSSSKHMRLYLIPFHEKNIGRNILYLNSLQEMLDQSNLLLNRGFKINKYKIIIINFLYNLHFFIVFNYQINLIVL